MPPISSLLAAVLIAVAAAVSSEHAEAACMLRVAPDGPAAAPELAGGPDELPSCNTSAYVKDARPSARTVHPNIVSVTRFRPPRQAGTRRDGALNRTFGVRYPGFVKVYSNTRYTGFRKVYSGPRYTGSTRGLQANRYPGFSKRYSGQRYSGFRRGYRGPRYIGEFGTTRRGRW